MAAVLGGFLSFGGGIGVAPLVPPRAFPAAFLPLGAPAAMKAAVAGVGPVCRCSFLFSFLPTTLDHDVVSRVCGAGGEEEEGVGMESRLALAMALVVGPAFSSALLGAEGGGTNALARCLASSLLFSLLFSLFRFFLASDVPLFEGRAPLAKGAEEGPG